jgi:hypothetical protein
MGTPQRGPTVKQVIVDPIMHQPIIVRGPSGPTQFRPPTITKTERLKGITAPKPHKFPTRASRAAPTPLHKH